MTAEEIKRELLNAGWAGECEKMYTKERPENKLTLVIDFDRDKMHFRAMDDKWRYVFSSAWMDYIGCEIWEGTLMIGETEITL